MNGHFRESLEIGYDFLGCFSFSPSLCRQERTRGSNMER